MSVDFIIGSRAVIERIWSVSKKHFDRKLSPHGAITLRSLDIFKNQSVVLEFGEYPGSNATCP